MFLSNVIFSAISLVLSSTYLSPSRQGNISFLGRNISMANPFHPEILVISTLAVILIIIATIIRQEGLFGLQTEML